MHEFVWPATVIVCTLIVCRYAYKIASDLAMARLARTPFGAMGLAAFMNEQEAKPAD